MLLGANEIDILSIKLILIVIDNMMTIVGLFLLLAILMEHTLIRLHSIIITAHNDSLTD